MPPHISEIFIYRYNRIFSQCNNSNIALAISLISKINIILEIYQYLFYQNRCRREADFWFNLIEDGCSSPWYFYGRSQTYSPGETSVHKERKKEKDRKTAPGTSVDCAVSSRLAVVYTFEQRSVLLFQLRSHFQLHDDASHAALFFPDWVHQRGLELSRLLVTCWRCRDSQWGPYCLSDSTEHIIWSSVVLPDRSLSPGIDMGSRAKSRPYYYCYYYFSPSSHLRHYC